MKRKQKQTSDKWWNYLISEFEKKEKKRKKRKINKITDLIDAG